MATIPPKLHRHLRRIAALGGQTRTPARAEAARLNGLKGGHHGSSLATQAKCFAEHVARGTRPSIGPRLHAYILDHYKDKDVRAAANDAKADRTVWTLTAEAAQRERKAG